MIIERNKEVFFCKLPVTTYEESFPDPTVKLKIILDLYILVNYILFSLLFISYSSNIFKILIRLYLRKCQNREEIRLLSRVFNSLLRIPIHFSRRGLTNCILCYLHSAEVPLVQMQFLSLRTLISLFSSVFKLCKSAKYELYR